jgi:3-hydroxypropanoate dehydrogenase
LEHSQHIKQIFTEARTHRFFTDQLVEDNILKQLYEVVKNAPTASNTCPMRVTFVKSAVEKAKLLEVIAEGNKPKAATAPVIAIVSYDMKFFDHLDNLAPHLDKSNFAQMSEDAIRTQASNNTWLQGGYLILAARALGLDCGAMAGFDRERTNKLFFNNSSWRAAFLLSLGYGSGKNIRDRAPRLSFEDTCKIV